MTEHAILVFARATTGRARTDHDRQRACQRGAAAGPLFAADLRMQLNGLNMLPDLNAGPDAPYGHIPVVTPREISNAVLFLASDEARYITGVALPVDAGNTSKP